LISRILHTGKIKMATPIRGSLDKYHETGLDKKGEAASTK
jgi:hypothetical protein